MTIARARSLAVAMVCGAVLVSACHSPGADVTGGGGERPCASVSAPLTEIHHSSDEPRVFVPQPPGWESATPVESQRIALANRGLIHDGFVPTASVTVARGELKRRPPAQATVSMEDRLLDLQTQNLVGMGGATGLTVSRHRVCGFPAQTVRYTAPPKKPAVPQRSAAQLTAIAQTDDSTYYTVNLAVETTDPSDPAYQRDSATMLDGFQVLPPG